MATTNEAGLISVEAVKRHPLSEHRFVLYDYGADVHFHHKPSGLTLHLHGCFLGADLDVATINEKLGDCYLPLAAVVHFFELIEFAPGISRSGRVYDTLTSYEQKSEMWVDALLVADLLGLRTMVEDLFDMVKSPPRIPHSTILMAIEDRHVHSKDVIGGICKLAVFAIDDIYNDDMDIHEVTRLLAPLATDPSYGVECYGKLIAESVKHHTVHVMKKENTSALDLLYDDSVGPLRSADVTSAWRRGFAQFFDVYIGFAKKQRSNMYSCVPGLSTETDDEVLAQLPLVVTVDTGYVRGAPFLANPQSHLPYKIQHDEEDKTVKLYMSDNRTIASVFGESIRDGHLIVVADEDCDVHLIGQVKDLDEWSTTIDVPLITKDVKRDQFNIRDVLSVKSGNCRGHYRLSSGTRFPNRLIEVTPGYNHTRDEIGVVAIQDPVLATANFVVQCDSLSGDCVQYGFLVHDWVLHQTWPYFRSVVDAGMSEVTERSVSFCGMPPLTLRALMSCLFTGDADDCNQVFSSELVDKHLEYIGGDNGALFGLRGFPALKNIVTSRSTSMYAVPFNWTGMYMLGGSVVYPAGFVPSANALDVNISTNGTAFAFSSMSPMY